MGGFLIGFLYAVFYCAVVILGAYIILLVLKWLGWSPDENVLKWGKIVVTLLCVIVLLSWLFGALGIMGSWPVPLLR